MSRVAEAARLSMFGCRLWPEFLSSKKEQASIVRQNVAIVQNWGWSGQAESCQLRWLPDLQVGRELSSYSTGEIGHHLMPQVFQAEQHLIDALEASIRGIEPQIVGIDGLRQVGKSTLARKISVDFQCPILEIDDFVLNGELFYPRSLDVAGLASALKAAYRTSNRLIIDSILLLDVAAIMNIRLTTHIYLHSPKREQGLRAARLFDASSCRAVLDEISSTARSFGITDDQPLLDRELAFYHLQQSPQRVCDLLFLDSRAPQNVQVGKFPE